GAGGRAGTATTTGAAGAARRKRRLGVMGGGPGAGTGATILAAGAGRGRARVHAPPPGAAPGASGPVAVVDRDDAAGEVAVAAAREPGGLHHRAQLGLRRVLAD